MRFNPNHLLVSRKYAEAVKDTSTGSSVQTVERLLTALAALNKIWYVYLAWDKVYETCVTNALHSFSMIPDIAAALDEAQEEYSSREANIQFLRTSCDEVCNAEKDDTGSFGIYGQVARLSTVMEGIKTSWEKAACVIQETRTYLLIRILDQGGYGANLSCKSCTSNEGKAENGKASVE